MLIAEWLYQTHLLLYQTSWVNQFEEFTWNGKILEDFLKTVQNPVWELSFFVSTNFNLRFFVSSNCALTSFVLTFYSCKSCCKWRPQLTLVSILYFALFPSYFVATISCIVCLYQYRLSLIILIYTDYVDGMKVITIVSSAKFDGYHCIDASSTKLECCSKTTWLHIYKQFL